MTNIDELGRLALAATPGPHHIYTHPRDDNNWDANKAWHEAASPQVFMGLIERLKQAEQDAARYRWIRRHERFHIAVGDDADAVFSSAADEPEDLDDAIDCALQAEQKGGA